MLNPRLDLLVDYPFQRLAALLNCPGGGKVVNMSIGEPQHQPPSFVGEILAQEAAGWGKYPPMNGILALRQAIADWLTWRFDLKPSKIDPECHLLPLAGTRGGLFQVAMLADNRIRSSKTPVILLPNPFYQIYAGAGLIAGAELHFMPALRENGFLPDFSTLPREILERTVLAYICTPSNPEGAVASREYLKNVIGLARQYGFILASDECYSEIYSGNQPPAGALSVVDDDFDNILVFHSLSKRSSAPGLRSGFVAGDAKLVAAFAKLNTYGGGAIPLPVQSASVALWQDEKHVTTSRILYQQKFDIADRLFHDWSNYSRPSGGFYLWLPVEDSEGAALRLWQRGGIRVLPGAYLARDGFDGQNPGKKHIRIALVQSLGDTADALGKIHDILGHRSAEILLE